MMIVKVLGSGCAKCDNLEKETKSALDELNLEYTIEHVTDFMEIASYGVMVTPALVIDGKVISAGRNLSKKDIIKLLNK